MDSDYGLVYATAMRMLAAREHSTAELRAKLVKKSDDQAAIAKLIDEFTEAGYLNDERFAEIFVRQKSQVGKGPYVIRQLLKAKGIGEQHIAAAFNNNDSDWFELAMLAYQKKFRTPIEDIKDKAKRQRFLMSRGFSSDVISKVIESCPSY